MRVSLERREEDRGGAGGHCSRDGCWLAEWMLACWVDAGLLESPSEHGLFIVSDREDGKKKEEKP